MVMEYPFYNRWERLPSASISSEFILVPSFSYNALDLASVDSPHQVINTKIPPITLLMFVYAQQLQLQSTTNMSKIARYIISLPLFVL